MNSKTPWSFNLTTNTILYNGEETSLTTDDVVWTETVKANGIVPYGGITLSTEWKEGQNLTDTIRQLIEKVIIIEPQLIINPELPMFLAKGKNSGQYKFIFNPGKYINDQETGVTLGDVSIKIYTDDGNIKEENIDINNYILDLSKYVTSDININRLEISYTYSDGQPPKIDGASKEYIDQFTIKSDTKIINHIFNQIDGIYYTFTNNQITDNNIIDIIEDCNIFVDYKNKNIFETGNAIGDSGFLIALPASISNKYPVLYYHLNYNNDNSDDGIDYSEFYQTTTINYENIEYYVYYFNMIESFDNSNSFTIKLDDR